MSGVDTKQRGQAPHVIKLFAKLPQGFSQDSVNFYSYHLFSWLRLSAIPGKPGAPGHPAGNLLSREDAKLIESSVRQVFGNFVFLRLGIDVEGAQRVAEALKRASRIFWRQQQKSRTFHMMKVIKNPTTYRPLHQFLLRALRGRYDARSEDEIERLAEYFAIFYQHNRGILKELALSYHSLSKERDQLVACLPSDD